MKSVTGALLLTLVSSAVWAQVNMGDQKPEANVPFKMETVAAFTLPWRMAFLPDGRMLVTEKVGPLWLVTPQGRKTMVTNTPPVYWQGQNGMHGVYLSPTYATDQRIYLTYVEPGDYGGGLALARARLNITPTNANLQNFEVLWRQLPRGRGGQEGAAVAFSPDDRLLARGISRGPLELWDTQTWEQTDSFSGHFADVYTQTISFSPDSKLLAAPARRETIVWDLASRRQRHVLKGHAGNCQAAVFSPDGTQLATSSRDATIKLWDVETGTLLGNLTGHTHGVASLAWHPSGKRLASAAWDGTSRLWDLASRREQGMLGGHGRHVFSVAWHPHGNQLATGGDDWLVKLWKPDVAREALLLADAANPLVSLRYSADGAVVVTGDDKGNVALWNGHTGKLLRQFADAPRPVRGVALHEFPGLLAARDRLVQPPALPHFAPALRGGDGIAAIGLEHLELRVVTAERTDRRLAQPRLNFRPTPGGHDEALGHRLAFRDFAREVLPRVRPPVVVHPEESALQEVLPQAARVLR